MSTFTEITNFASKAGITFFEAEKYISEIECSGGTFGGCKTFDEVSDTQKMFVSMQHHFAINTIVKTTHGTILSTISDFEQLEKENGIQKLEEMYATILTNVNACDAVIEQRRTAQKTGGDIIALGSMGKKSFILGPSSFQQFEQDYWDDCVLLEVLHVFLKKGPAISVVPEHTVQNHYKAA